MHKITIIAISLLILASLTPILNINAASTLFVQIDSQSYSIGDVVPIQVFYTMDPPLPGVTVDITLEISTPTGWPIDRTITVTSNSQGEASGLYSFSLDNADPGTYSVTAFADGTTSNAETFTVGDAANNGNNGPAFDYSIGLSPSTVTVQAGDDAIFRVLLTYSDPSFSGTVVTIQLAGLGPGMTYQLSGIGDLIIYTTSSTPPGTYPLTIIGSANGVVHQTTGMLIVQEQAEAFEYSISISPASKTLSLGDSGAFTVTVTLTSGDPETVSLSVNGLPGDFQHSFSQASGNPTFTSTLTIDTSSSTSTGTYNFSVTASGGGQSETTGALLIVSEEADFSISITPPSRIINQGDSSTFTVTLNKIGDFNEQVTLTASGLPTGATPSFGPTSGKPAFTSTLNIDTSKSTSPGNYTVTVDASGGGKTHSTTAILTIKEKSGEATPEDEVDQDESAEDEDVGTDLLPSSMRNPRNLMLIMIAILAIIIIVMLVRRQRTPPMPPAETVKTADTTLTYCTKCGAQLKPGTTFCSSCGNRVE
ncbi:zinc-ribbon domain-containing protein [[Eubacterium] cellulosolvens]